MVLLLVLMLYRIDQCVNQTIPVMITIILTLLAFVHLSSNTPLNSTTSGMMISPRGFVSSNDATDPPDLRTTLDIFWSCVTTLFSCTWAAMHPNLPEPRTSGWSWFKRRIKLMIAAVIVPEYILLWALRQRNGAEYIMKEYNSIILGSRFFKK